MKLIFLAYCEHYVESKWQLLTFEILQNHIFLKFTSGFTLHYIHQRIALTTVVPGARPGIPDEIQRKVQSFRGVRCLDINMGKLSEMTETRGKTVCSLMW